MECNGLTSPLVFSIFSSSNNKFSKLLSIMAKIVAKIKKRRLPLKFTANHLFPEEWPETDRDGQHRTPLQSSPEWAAIVDFRESESWKDGDLQMFADYFHVKHNSLSAKIIRTLEQRNTDSSRKALSSIQGRRKRTKLSSLKDTLEVQAPPAPHAGEPPDRIPLVQQGVLGRPRAPRRAFAPARAAICDFACMRKQETTLRRFTRWPRATVR